MLSQFREFFPVRQLGGVRFDVVEQFVQILADAFLLGFEIAHPALQRGIVLAVAVLQRSQPFRQRFLLPIQFGEAGLVLHQFQHAGQKLQRFGDVFIELAAFLLQLLFHFREHLGQLFRRLVFITVSFAQLLGHFAQLLGEWLQFFGQFPIQVVGQLVFLDELFQRLGFLFHPLGEPFEFFAIFRGDFLALGRLFPQVFLERLQFAGDLFHSAAGLLIFRLQLVDAFLPADHPVEIFLGDDADRGDFAFGPLRFLRLIVFNPRKTLTTSPGDKP